MENTGIGFTTTTVIIPIQLTSHCSGYHSVSRFRMTSADCHFEPVVAGLCPASDVTVGRCWCLHQVSGWASLSWDWCQPHSPEEKMCHSPWGYQQGSGERTESGKPKYWLALFIMSKARNSKPIVFKGKKALITYSSLCLLEFFFQTIYGLLIGLEINNKEI